MITRVALVDEVTPAVAAWIQDLNPAAGRALLRAGRVIRRAAIKNVRAMFKRTGRNRTLEGMRGIKVREDRAAGIRVVRVWHGMGLLAAQELGATIPPTTIRPKTMRVLGWGGVGRQHTHFRTGEFQRRSFTLRKRRTLEPAYYANLHAVPELLEAEYEKLLALAPPALRT